MKTLLQNRGSCFKLRCLHNIPNVKFFLMHIKWFDSERLEMDRGGRTDNETLMSSSDSQQHEWLPAQSKHRHWRSGDGWEDKQRWADISARRSCCEHGWTDRLRETDRAGWFVTHDWLGTELQWKRQQNQSDECLVEAGCQSKQILFLNLSLSVRTMVLVFVFLIEICHKLGFINTFCKQWSGLFRRSPHDGESERSQNTSLRMECFPLDGPMHDVHEVKPWDNFQFLNQKGHCLTVRYCNITVLPHVALPTSIIGRLTNCVC